MELEPLGIRYDDQELELSPDVCSNVPQPEAAIS
jgi:hypothetical protein